MKILMVCLGNICRSPLAHGILYKKVVIRQLDWEIDSAGTSGYHNGHPPHQGSILIAKENNIDISQQHSRKITPQDLDYYDLILAMDTSNYQHIMQLTENQAQKDKIKLILNFVHPPMNRAVPDPYYSGNFQEVYDLLDEATDAIIAELG